MTIKLSRIHNKNDLPGDIWVKTYFILISTSYFFLNWIRFSNYWLKWRLLVKFHYQFHHEFSNAGCSRKIWQGYYVPILIHWLSVRKLWSDNLTLIGKFLRPFTGKLIHQKIMSTYSVLKKMGRDLDRLLENSSRPNVTNHNSYMVSVKKKRMDDFSSKTVCVTSQNWKTE